MTISNIQAGHLDVHAHLLPESSFTVPTADGSINITEKDGDLLLGETPMHVDATKLTSIERLVADMDEHGIAVRVVSPPPYAFPSEAPVQDAADYARLINEDVVRACGSNPGRLLALGVVPLQDELATRTEMAYLRQAGAVGIAVPPIVGDAGIGDPALEHVLAYATELDLSVLVHPTQALRPGYGNHYLRNLIGNPVETTVGIASYLLGNGPQKYPDLRIVFLHGAGCAPALLGRWDHGWRLRADVSADTAAPPSESFITGLYADTLTHSDATAELLKATIDSAMIVLGSDYPFDMADIDPVASAHRRGFDVSALEQNARRWLGITAGPSGE
jgi:aminocarboxymuconate-semialdehyde decarboxylase